MDGGDVVLDTSAACGNAVRVGETGVDIELDGGDVAGVETSAQAAPVSRENPPAPDTQELFPDAMPSLLSSSGVEEVMGLGDDDGALAMTESGGKMVKI